MISSPCKDCPNRHLPKDKCLSNCEILQTIQELQLSVRQENGGCGIDYAEEGRYIINRREVA